MNSFAATPGFAGRRPTPTPVRLTRRGQVVLTVVFVALLMTVLTVFGSHSAATGESGTPVRTHAVVVGRGDTLWGIASKVAAPGKVGEMVIRIRELNALSTSGLAVGQRIAVPIG